MTHATRNGLVQKKISLVHHGVQDAKWCTRHEVEQKTLNYLFLKNGAQMWHRWIKWCANALREVQTDTQTETYIHMTNDNMTSSTIAGSKNQNNMKYFEAITTPKKGCGPWYWQCMYMIYGVTSFALDGGNL